jgi:hypothetical protein
MKRHRIYGLDLASEVAFERPVPELSDQEATGAPDVTFERVEDAPLPGEDDTLLGEGAETVYRSPERRPDGRPVLSARSARGTTGPVTLLSYAGEATFSVGERRIVARPEAPGVEGESVTELRLLGPVLAFWLERSGVPVLHASAVTVDGRAVALLAGSRGGKSSLAAALLDRGHPLLTDDVLAVRGTRAQPSYPQMRFEPEDAARRLAGEGGPDAAARLPRAHPEFAKLRMPVGGAQGFGRFDPEPRPLARIYLPERRADGERVTIEPVSIEPVRGREAVLALVAGSFLPRLVEAMGWAGRRLDLLARLADAVPVRRISFPEGLERLPEVAARLADDALQG